MPKKVLVVDDSIMIRKLVGATLTEKKMEVEFAEDGAAALEILKSFAPQLIICDFNMPRLNGPALVRTIRNDEEYGIHKFVPVLMLTSEKTEERINEGMAAGVSAWMIKPFLPERLVSAVEKLLGFDG